MIYLTVTQTWEFIRKRWTEKRIGDLVIEPKDTIPEFDITVIEG